MSSNVRSAAHPRGRASILLEFLGSMNLAITLLAAVAFASVIGTVLKQNQSYQDYIIKFGPFWFHVFKTMGLYDVYSSSWFLCILTFLVVSTSVCIYRNAPTMVRDMLHYRFNVQFNSLRAFHSKEEWLLERDPQAAEQAATACARANGYRVRRQDHGDHVVLAAMKGGAGRLGYIFTHLAIVVICVGALIDGNVALKIKAALGQIKIETRDIPASQVPAISRLPVSNPSFRGSVTIPEGSSVNLLFLQLKDGYLVQPLPFDIELKHFHIEHYATGQPKSFESDLVIHDPQRHVTLARKVTVNHPLTYRGYTIYQSSFRDGGSHLDIKAWPLDMPSAKPESIKTSVYDDVPIKTPVGPLRLEFTDFRFYNINPVMGKDGKQTVSNFGPSITYKVRDAAGQATEYQNYMVPVEQDGRLFYLSGMRSTPSAPYRFLHIPAEPGGGIGRFMRFNAMLHDQAAVRSVAERIAKETFADASLTNPKMYQQVVDTTTRLVRMFADGGFDSIVHQVDSAAPKDKRKEVLDAYMKVLQNVLGSMYVDELRQEGMDLSKGVSPTEAQFYDDALGAINELAHYRAPVYLQLANFQQVQATGLQIARTPGKNVVYLGFGLLIVGVFMTFYVAHRRLWFWIDRDGDRTRLLMAGSGNRNRRDFEKEFGTLRESLQRYFHSS